MKIWTTYHPLLLAQVVLDAELPSAGPLMDNSTAPVTHRSHTSMRMHRARLAVRQGWALEFATKNEEAMRNHTAANGVMAQTLWKTWLRAPGHLHHACPSAHSFSPCLIP